VWLLTNTNPYFKRPNAHECSQCGKPPVHTEQGGTRRCEDGHKWIDWGTEPLLILIVGQDRLQIEQNLWRRLILPFLNPEDWKEVKSGNQVVSAQHVTEGHQIVFLSHNHGSEDDRRHLQSYAAHYVWVDESPKSSAIFEELQRRIDSKYGRFIATLTLKSRNEGIRKVVDSVDPRIGHVYRLNKLDNPIYKGREEEELAKISHLPLSVQNNIMRGDWITSDTAVYTLVPELHCGVPQLYGPQWRHVLSVDPATESKLGATLWAECPRTNVWWAVKADYFDGSNVPSKTPVDYIDAVEKWAAGVNIVMRCYDSAAPWFARQAMKMPDGRRYIYLPVEFKSGNKQDMIAAFQQALGPEIRIADWCTLLIDEIEKCERSESNPDKIVNSSSFHLIDSAHYFLRRKPPRAVHTTFETHADYLIAHDDAVRAAEKARLLARVNKNRVVRARPTNRRWV
jgi:hypothetical protein